MKVGPLDKRLVIKLRTLTQDSTTGQDVVSYEEPLGTVWANVQDGMPSNDEALSGGVAQVTVIKTRVRIRWRDDIDTSMRFELDYPRPRVLQIIGGPAEINGRKSFLEFMCEEVVSGR